MANEEQEKLFLKFKDFIKEFESVSCDRTTVCGECPFFEEVHGKHYSISPCDVLQTIIEAKK